MKLHDIVTVKTPTQASESGFLDNPEYIVTPGTPCVFISVENDNQVVLHTLMGPKHRLNLPWYFTTTLNNLVLIAKPDATSFNTANLDRDGVNEVVRLLQSNIKKASFYTTADAMNQSFNRGQWYDRWGRAWHSEEVFNSVIKEAQERGGDFTESMLQAMHAAWMTYRWTQTNPHTKAEPKIRPTKSKYVNVYCDDRAYGGPQEGGWWYDTSNCVESIKVSRKAANQLLKVKQRECDEENEGNPPISSVLSRGFYHAKIENRPGKDYPGYRPTYS
jgi:hypothetical protein